MRTNREIRAVMAMLRGPLMAMLALSTGLLTREAVAACSGVGNFSCSATVSATPLAFGSYDPSQATPRDSTSAVTVVGTIGGAVGVLVTFSYSVSLDAGSGGGAISARKMAGVSSTLDYNLYTSALRNVIWGANDVVDSYAVLLNLGGAPPQTRTYTVYGRIPANQYVTPGSYSSTIGVTVNY